MKYREDPRHQARKLALSVVFSNLFQDAPEAHELPETDRGFISDILEKNLVYDKDLYHRIVQGVAQHKEELTKTIELQAVEWPADKISKVDLAILLISIYELIYSPELSEKVVIDEAVELAKEFGNDSSKKFTNGVLGSVAHALKAENIKND